MQYKWEMYHNASCLCFWCPVALIYILGYRAHILTSLTRRLAWSFHILWLIELGFQICSAHQHANWRGWDYFSFHFTELCIVSEWFRGHRHEKSSGFKFAPIIPENKTIKIKLFPQCLKTKEMIKNSLWGKWVWGNLFTALREPQRNSYALCAWRDVFEGLIFFLLSLGQPTKTIIKRAFTEI